MSKEENKPGKNKVADSYRLVVYRSDDYQEVRSFNLSPGSIYVALSVLLLVLCLGIYSLIAFTPVKKLIPGYGQIEVNDRFIRLADGVNEIDRSVADQQVYIESLRKLLGTGLADPNMEAIVNTSPRVTEARPIRVNEDASSVLSPQAIDENTNSKGDLYEMMNQVQVYQPVSGVVSSEFDPSIKHFGLDILAPASTPILSMMDGYVFSSGWDLETGYTIGIQHEGNLLSFYKHNSQLLKEKGTFVKAGEAVAIIGNTGTLSSGPHLHFEIWHNGQPINPQDILKLN